MLVSSVVVEWCRKVWWGTVVMVTMVMGGGAPVIASQNNKVVCYYASWAHYRQGAAQYKVKDIPVESCTHVVYAFAVLDPSSLTLTPHDSHLDTAAGLDNYRTFLQLRRLNPHIKLLLGLGGWTDSRSDKYSRLVSESFHRATFIHHVLDFLTSYGFDGLDLDWEFPGDHARHQDKKGFRLWVQELSSAFKSRGLLLTAAVSAGKSTIDEGYDVAAVAKALDHIHLMTYDMHGSWESNVANHAPLFPDPGSNSELSVDFVVQYWLKKGAPAGKLVLGVPLYGRSWTLSGGNANVGAAASGAGKPGPLMKAAGSLAYYEVCQAHQTGWRKVSAADGPYLTNGNQWVGYDDVTTIIKKVQYARENGLGGVMLWDVTMDDFKGSCGEGVNPLILALSQAIGSPNTLGLVRPFGSTRPSLHFPEPTTQASRSIQHRPLPTSQVWPTSQPRLKPGNNNKNNKGLMMDLARCGREGYTGDSRSCSHFFRCDDDRVFHFRCPEGLHWRQNGGVCDWPQSALCKI